MDKAKKIDCLQGLIIGCKEKLHYANEMEDTTQQEREQIIDEYFYAMREIFFNENFT
jgi:hypothetical protein